MCVTAWLGTVQGVTAIAVFVRVCYSRLKHCPLLTATSLGFVTPGSNTAHWKQGDGHLTAALLGFVTRGSNTAHCKQGDGQLTAASLGFVTQDSNININLLLFPSLLTNIRGINLSASLHLVSLLVSISVCVFLSVCLRLHASVCLM